jgi:hypothetical protein
MSRVNLLKAQGTRARSARTGLTLTGLIATLALALLVPASSLAAFTRPFVKQITGTPGGPFQGPGGIATDGTGNLWVADTAPEVAIKLSEFDSSGGFMKTLEPTEGLTRPEREADFPIPESLAIDRSISNGRFYLTGREQPNGAAANLDVLEGASGKLLKRREVAKSAHVAIDNSCSLHKPVLTELTFPSCKEFDPSNGSVYVSHGEPASGGSLPAGVEKFEVNAANEPIPTPFTASAEYIAGDQIIGTTQGPFQSAEPTPGAIAVDSHGNIYAIGETKNNVETLAVYEYEPGGKLVRAFTSKETPGVAGSREEGGWGGQPKGLSFDPVTEHLLVSIHHVKVEGALVKGESAIDEFEVASGKYFGQITATNPKEAGAHLHDPKEMTIDSLGDLYVVDNTAGSLESEAVHVVDEYGPPGPNTPSVKLGEASERTPASAMLSGSVNPDGQPLRECHFEYVSEEAFKSGGFSTAETAECEPTASAISQEPNLEAYYPVKATLIGLSSGTTYRYRLVATTEGGGGAFTEPAAFTAPAKPRIESTSADNLSSRFADLHATIDPRGAATAYRFQYLTEAEYQANGESFAGAVATPEVGIGSGGSTGSAPAAALQHLAGLRPSTVYRFRAVATNEIGTAEGEEAELTAHTFATPPQVAAGLPDNRAYELVTPPDKGSSGDMFSLPLVDGEFFNHDVGTPSESGDQFLLQTTAAFGPFPASGVSAYVFSRTPSGWAYVSLASPALGVQSISETPVFNPADLSRVGFTDEVGSGNSTAGSSNTSLLGAPGGPYTTLHADLALGGGRDEEETQVVGASRDLSHLLLQSKNHTLAPAAASQDKGSTALYESNGGGECSTENENCALVNVNSEGGLLSPCGAVLGLGTASLGVPFEPVSAGEATPGKTHNAVSPDGSRVLFTSPDPRATGSHCWVENGATRNNTYAPQLYMRSHGQTVELSAPAPGAPEPEVPGHHLAQFVGASTDDSRVFFVSAAELTPSDAGIHDSELYEWRSQGTGGCAETSPDYDPASGGCLSRVSAGEPTSPAASAGAAIFAVPQVSAQGAAVYFIANGVLASGASPGDCAGHAGACSLYRYDTATAATVYVATVAATSWTMPTGGEEAAFGLGSDPIEPWYATPDGRYLLYKNGPKLYRYQAPTAALPDGELLCVSCNPTGAAPSSEANFVRSARETGNYAGGPVSAMSNDGSYVFFDTADALVPTDTNRTLDVYEWHEGALSLISSGHDSAPSFFLGSSPDGSNVFFGTHARLLPQDRDSAGDIYDARICTESDPCIQPPPGETAQCEGGACQSPPPLALFQTPATLTLASSGNLATEPPPPTKCKKGFVKKKKRCVRKPRPKKKAKKSSRDRRAGR